MELYSSPNLGHRRLPRNGSVPAGTWLGGVEEGGLGRQRLPLRRIPQPQPDPRVLPLSGPTAPPAPRGRGRRPLSAPSPRPRPVSRAPSPARKPKLPLGPAHRSPRPRRPSGSEPRGARARGGSRVPHLRARARDPLAGHPPGGAEPSGDGAGCPSRGSRSGPGLRRRRRRRLLLQEGAESSDFLLEGQLPPIDHTQRASSRQHPSQPLSLPPCLRPRSLAPPVSALRPRPGP